MYKVIIVDDEFFAAKLLEKYISVYVDGFEVTEIFEDGTDVVKYLANGGTADVIITDIKMRKMSGVKLAEYIHTMNYNIAVIFVSAYSDFEYAKEALDYDVFGYLLKTVDVDELKEMMQSLKCRLDYDKNSDIEDVELQREYFIENLLLKNFGSIDDMYIEQEKCKYLGDAKHLKCTIFKIVFSEESELNKFISIEGTDKIEATLIGIIKCAMNKKYVSCILNKEKVFYMGVVDDEGEFDFEYLENLIGDIFASGVGIKIIMSGSFDDFFEADEQLFNFIVEEKGTKYQHVNSNKKIIVENALNYIKENLGSDLCRDSVAQAVGLTPAYFGKVFKAVMGVTFSDYLNEQRMKYAQKLLLEDVKTVDVCLKIGIFDERHFRRIFKAYCGMTPTEYRKTAERSGEN